VGRRRSLASSALETFSANVVVSGLSLVNVLITARALGAAGRGEVAFLTTVAALTSQIATMGIQQANVNFAGSEPRLLPALMSNSLVLAGLLGTAAAGILAGAVAIVPAIGGSATGPLLALALVSLPVLILRIFLEFLAHAGYRFRLTNFSYLLIAILTCTVNGSLAVAGVLSVGTAVGAWIAGQALAATLLWWRLGGFRRRPQRPDVGLARRMLGFGLRAHGGRVMLLGNYRVDQWILGSVAGSRELGVYSVAVAWSETLFFISQALSQVQRPDLVRAKMEQAGQRAAAVLRVALAATILAGLAIAALAPVLCVGFFGEEFRDAVGLTRILACGALGIAALKVLGNALTAQGMPLRETAAIGVAFTAIVALDAALIPALGAEGAALASVIAYTLGGFAVALIFLRSLPARTSWLIPRPADAWLAARQLTPLLATLRRAAASVPWRR
jgi:O-antigen/teichoic acid export membrane protein